MAEDRLTAEEFAARRAELPEHGRWSELVDGQIVDCPPPGEIEGLVVLNLSRAVGQWLQPRAADPPCSPCYEPGLVLARNPDTVCFPAIGFFPGMTAFAEAGRDVTENVPLLAIELAGTASQQDAIPERVARYTQSGVQSVWIVDTRARAVHLHRPETTAPLVLDSAEAELHDPRRLPGFRLRLEELFQNPDWWA